MTYFLKLFLIIYSLSAVSAHAITCKSVLSSKPSHLFKQGEALKVEIFASAVLATNLSYYSQAFPTAFGNALSDADQKAKADLVQDLIKNMYQIANGVDNTDLSAYSSSAFNDVWFLFEPSVVATKSMKDLLDNYLSENLKAIVHNLRQVRSGNNEPYDTSIGADVRARFTDESPRNFQPLTTDVGELPESFGSFSADTELPENFTPIGAEGELPESFRSFGAD